MGSPLQLTQQPCLHGRQPGQDASGPAPEDALTDTGMDRKAKKRIQNRVAQRTYRKFQAWIHLNDVSTSDTMHYRQPNEAASPRLAAAGLRDANDPRAATNPQAESRRPNRQPCCAQSEQCPRAVGVFVERLAL